MAYRVWAEYHLLSDPEVVPQTDLVPTLPLLLGIPIPYSSVGQVLLPHLPADSQTGSAPAGLSQAEALWINAKQIFASVCAVGILRRHLMVWKVFALKLVFEA
uniref:Uncharacterized protein n=1 Tax=Hucho hucho TaxID=62062 RepID=A0A4W5PDN3_9TELE